ncbi:MAG: MBL fold metallo-hydrolase [Bacteroidales bacterium]|nr:MBL fold metallo-hydrolase [Bacteroidales bacterium]MDZ4204075.1 MBL fold metallo-hydrolase [Bacteroidales bacterium]
MKTQIYTLRLGINRCYIIMQQGMIMVDAGPPNSLNKIKRYLKTFGIDPADIQLVILTHGDFDHLGGAQEIKELTGAEIAIHEADKENLEEGRFNWPKAVTIRGKILRFLLAPLFKRIVFKPVKADITLNDLDFSLKGFGIDGKIIHTPGHTKGSVSILLDTGEAFVGCMAHNNRMFRFSPGLPIFAEDLDTIKISWKKLVESGANIIYPGHGNPFPLKKIMHHLGV